MVYLVGYIEHQCILLLGNNTFLCCSAQFVFWNNLLAEASWLWVMKHCLSIIQTIFLMKIPCFQPCGCVEAEDVIRALHNACVKEWRVLWERRWWHLCQIFISDHCCFKAAVKVWNVLLWFEVFLPKIWLLKIKWWRVQFWSASRINDTL